MDSFHEAFRTHTKKKSWGKKQNYPTKKNKKQKKKKTSMSTTIGSYQTFKPYLDFSSRSHTL